MRILKEYNEFKMNGFHEETSDLEQLIGIRDLLSEIEIDMEKEVDALGYDIEINHTDLQKRYPMFSVINDIGEITYRTGKLMNYLDFIKGYE